MTRWDAWFIATLMVVVLVLGFLAAELLAQALQPVSDALMQGTKAITVEVVR